MTGKQRTMIWPRTQKRREEKRGGAWADPQNPKGRVPPSPPGQALRSWDVLSPPCGHCPLCKSTSKSLLCGPSTSRQDQSLSFACS